jgi:hypothetical protein
MAFLLFLTAIVLSGIAAYYSIIGLIAIFSAAIVPVAVMGTSLEVAKLVVASWLYRFWDKIPILMRTYFTSALIILMLITSMGIFGFLSKAHLDQAVPAGEIAAKLSIIDEKIKTSKENIDVNRKALKQLDEAVDQIMGRSTTETGAERSVQIRRQQGPERKRLIAEIEAEQKKISQLNEERSPIAAEVRKVETEVGPLKYIAALIYGDNPDENTLEKAVRWLIIILIFVFDPLAVLMLIAANLTQIKQRELTESNKNAVVPAASEPPKEEPKNDESYKVIPDQTIMPMVVEATSELPTPTVNDTIATASIESAAPVEKVGVKKKPTKQVSKKKNIKPVVKSKKVPAKKIAVKKPTTPAKKQPSKKKVTKTEPVVEIKTEEVELKPQPIEQTANDKSLSEGFVPKPASIDDQVQQLIETDDQQGLEQIYKKIVKELAKNNRNKSTHWGPIKNAKNG